MRILYFHQHFSTPRGSAGTRSYSFAHELVERGHDVTIVCGSYGMGNTGLHGQFNRGRREGVVDGINVVEFSLPYSNKTGFVGRTMAFVRFAFRSTMLALFRPCDIVFATSTPLTAAIPGIVARLLRRRRFVFEVRDLWPELPRAMGVISNPIVLSAMSALEWLAYNTADACVGLAPGIVEGIRKRSRADKKIRLISNGSEEFTGQFDEYELTAINKDDFVAIFAGAHGHANGLDAVLDAARVLKERGESHIKLLLVGDGMRKRALVERADREQLTNCVFHEPLPRKQLSSVYLRANVGLMILANIPEFANGTSPNKFFDYLAHGLPVVNNYPGWIADLIVEHNCGLVVAPDDPEEFADALKELSKHPERLEAMSDSSRALLRQRFSYRKLAGEFADFLEEAAAS